jgi:exopolyphosphatase/pppGpp-phosphohydrolase
MTSKQHAVSLVKRFQEAHPHIKKNKEEAIASAILATEIVMESIKWEYMDISDWAKLRDHLIDL